jgi:hypothetical protein
MLVRTGLGPQNYTIRELHSFTCVAALRDDGNFEISLESEEASDEFCQDYPHLSEAVDESVKMGHPILQDPRGRRLMEEGQRRTRLLKTEKTQNNNHGRPNAKGKLSTALTRPDRNLQRRLEPDIPR